MKVAYVGSRDFKHLELVRNSIALLDPANDVVISGGARGVDTEAEQEAKKRGLSTIILTPAWVIYGKGAAFIRNKQIVEMADEVFAFWDGKSDGTRNTIYWAKKLQKPLTIFKDEGA